MSQQVNERLYELDPKLRGKHARIEDECRTSRASPSAAALVLDALLTAAQLRIELVQALVDLLHTALAVLRRAGGAHGRGVSSRMGMGF